MVSFDRYNLLAPEMQARVLFKFGVDLELIRSSTSLNIDLYALGDFYVEMYFDKATEEPLFVKAITVEDIDPYLSFVEIDSLFETN